MEGKIDATGILHIKRGSKMKSQTCQFSQDQGIAGFCGDHCPHFGEPELSTYLEDENGIKHSSTIIRQTCGNSNRWWDFKTFTDERA